MALNLDFTPSAMGINEVVTCSGLYFKKNTGCCVKNNSGRGKNRRLKGCSVFYWETADLHSDGGSEEEHSR